MKFTKFYILIFSLISVSLFSQDENKVYKIRDSLSYLISSKDIISKKDLNRLIKIYDFSNVWTSVQNVHIGFIDDNYKRFYIHFNKILKNRINPLNYSVEGRTRVENNICDFEGEMKIINIYLINKNESEENLKEALEHNDSIMINRNTYTEYFLMGEYLFNENLKQKSTGSFKGKFKTFFIIRNDSIIYDNINFSSDLFCNNLFVGIWKSNTKGIEEKCNWGDYRILDSGDLDIGTGEFYPNTKYLKNGWENYNNTFKGDKDAIKEEQRKWWEDK